MQEQHSVTGRLRVVLSNPSDGTILVDHWFPNLITTAGRDLLTQLMTRKKRVDEIFLQIGGYEGAKAGDESFPPATEKDTALHKPLHHLDIWLDDLVHQGTPQRAVQAISAKLPAGSKPIIVHEAGLVLSVGDDKVLYNRVVLSKPITKEALLEMTLTWEVIF